MLEFSGDGRDEECAYWLNSDASLKFKEGLKKAINWAKLNEDNYKEFEKEIVRIRVTPKATYNFYKRYITEYTDECKVVFKGFSSATFKSYSSLVIIPKSKYFFNSSIFDNAISFVKL